MILLKNAYSGAGIRVSPDTTDSKEQVCSDLSVGGSYMEAGSSESLALVKPYTLKPGGCIIVRTAEQVSLPKDVFGFLCSKGSLAARGLLVPNTKVDPMYSGHLDVAIFNAGQRILSVGPGMKFCSVAFQSIKGEVADQTPRIGPRISNEKKNKAWEFIVENRMLIITSILTIIISLGGAALTTWITIKMSN